MTNSRGFSGYAVSSFIFGLVGLCGGLPGIALGIAAVRRIRITGQRGRGLAVAGLVLSYIWLAVHVLGTMFFLFRDALESTQISPPPSRNPASNALWIGDCIGEVDTRDPAYRPPRVSCFEPHRGEVFGNFRLPDSSQPPVGRSDGIYCTDLQLQKYAGGSVSGTTRIVLLYPRDEDWAAGARTVVCVAYHETSQTGSVRTPPRPSPSASSR